MPRAAAKFNESVSVPSQKTGPELTTLEQELTEYFGSWGEVLGVPRSVTQIYGLLYANTAPLTFEVIAEKLGASKGSVSQGLKFLRERELIAAGKEVDGRREVYTAVASLGRFIQAQLRCEVAPRLESGARRAENLLALARESGDAEVAARMERLAGWNRRGNELLPMLLGLVVG